MSATSSQTHPNVKQAVASFNRRHFASTDDQFRVGSYVVYTPPPPQPPPTLARYTCVAAAESPASKSGPLTPNQRQPSRIPCLEDLAQISQRSRQHRKHPQTDDSPPSIESNRPIPVERQSIKLRQNSSTTSPTITPLTDSPSSKSNSSDEMKAISAFHKTVSSSSCRSQPICEAFIMTGQSMLKLSCTETNNNNNNTQTTTSLNNSNNNKLQQAQETRLDKFSSDTKLDNSLEAGTNRMLKVVSDRTVEINAITTAIDCVQNTGFTAGDSMSDPRTDVTAAGARLHTEATTNFTLRQSPDSTMVGEEHLVVEEEDKEETNPKKKNSIEPETLDCQPKCVLNSSHKMDDKSSLIDETSYLTASCMSSSSTGSCSYDRDSAKRLAKRLYSLSGFKKSDVSHHLGKSNQFSEMVAEEYLNLFDFKSMKLDAALRKFLSKFHLNGETQERERILSRFSQRYYICNRDKFPSCDIVQTLVCALILLNTDLHACNRGKKKKAKRSTLSLDTFIDGLNSSVATLAVELAEKNKESALNGNHQINGDAVSTPLVPYSFPRNILVDLYEAIKKKPLMSNEENCDMSMFESELDKIYSQHQNNQVASCRSSTLPTRRFLLTSSSLAAATMNSQTKHRYRLGLSNLDLFDNNNKLGQTCQLPANDKTIQPIQFKSGYLNKKRTFGANGKPTVKGKRGWSRVHVILVDLNLIFQCGTKEPQEHIRSDNQRTAAKQMKNSVQIYHSLAKPTYTYMKRNFVFHLELADQSEFLLQATDLNDMTSWIETINFASACLSAPVLHAAISSKSSMKSQKLENVTLPISYTKLKYWDQLVSHEERLQKLKSDLDEHLAAAPNTKVAKKSCKNRFIDRITYLRRDIQRYSVYVDLMRKKSNSNEAMVLSKNPHLTTSMVPSEKMIKMLPSIEGQAQLEFG